MQPHTELSFRGTDVPSAGPAAVGPITLGVWLQFDVDVRLLGFRAYVPASTQWFALFQMWNAAGDLEGEQVITKRLNQFTVAADGWRNVWLHPASNLLASTPYLLVYHTGNPVYRDDGVLTSGPITQGHVTALQSSAAPGGFNGVFDNTNAGHAFNFTVPPNNNAAGNLYAIDVLFRTI